MSATVFEKRGSSFLLTVPSLQTVLMLRHIRRRGGELHATLTVKTAIPGAKTYDDGLLVDGVGINLNSWTAHKTTAQRLEERAPTEGKVDWQGLVSELCIRASSADDLGEEAVEVGEMPRSSPHERWVVDPFAIRSGASVIYGAGGSGKSYLAYAMCLSVRMGREIVPGCPPAIKGPVVYLDWETDTRTANDRILSISGGCGVTGGTITYRRMRKSLADAADETAELVARKEAVFVVIDPVERAMGAKGEHSDMTDAVMRMYEAIDLFGGASVLLVDHVAKSELGRTHSNGPIGAVAKENTARLSWRAAAKEYPDHLEMTLYQHKRNDVPYHSPVGLRVSIEDGGPVRFETMTPATTAEPMAESDRPTAVALIRDLLDDPAVGYRAPEIARLLDLNPATVRQTLNRGDDFEKDASDVWRLRSTTVVPFRAPPGGGSGPVA